MLKRLLDDIDVKLATAKGALDAEDFDKLCKLSHATKGSALTAGTAALGAEAAALETAAKEKLPEVCHRCLASVTGAAISLRAALDSFLSVRPQCP